MRTVLERVDVGLTSVRFSHVMIAGSMSGRVSLVAEYESLASWATSIENENNDPAVLALVEEVLGPDGAATVVNRFLTSDIDV